MEINDKTAAAASALYPSMSEQPAPWVDPANPLEQRYSNSPELFRAPPPPAPLARESVMYPNSPSLHEAALREHEEHWARQSGFMDPSERTAAAAGLAALPDVVRGALVGSGLDQHPDTIEWLRSRR